MRARGYITADAREQTAYGTARGYIAVGIATTDTGAALTPSILGFNRAFIQWAGITAGLSQSFYDFYSAAAVGYRAYTSRRRYRRRRLVGVGLYRPVRRWLIGDALRGSSADDQIVDNAAALEWPLRALPNPGECDRQYCRLRRQQSPDIVGNLRVDQAWGSAQVMAAAHQDNAAYYGGTNVRPHRPSRRSVGLCRRRRLQLNYADDRARRLLPDAGQLHARWPQVPVRCQRRDQHGASRAATEGFGVMHRLRLRRYACCRPPVRRVAI